MGTDEGYFSNASCAIHLMRFHKTPQQSLPTISMIWLHVNYFCHGIQYQSISYKLCYIVLHRWDIFLSISCFNCGFVSYPFYRYYDFYWNPRHHRILVLYNGVLELHTCTRVNSRYVVLIYFI